jgi:hypothetical protein
VLANSIFFHPAAMPAERGRQLLTTENESTQQIQLAAILSEHLANRDFLIKFMKRIHTTASLLSRSIARGAARKRAKRRHSREEMNKILVGLGLQVRCGPL